MMQLHLIMNRMLFNFLQKWIDAEALINVMVTEKREAEKEEDKKKVEQG